MNRAQPPTTRRETIHGGSTPASMRVMVVDRCPRFMPLTVNGTAVINNWTYSGTFFQVMSISPRSAVWWERLLTDNYSNGRIGSTTDNSQSTSGLSQNSTDWLSSAHYGHTAQTKTASEEAAIDQLLIVILSFFLISQFQLIQDRKELIWMVQEH